jgi:nucleotide-binding universal stress UspA family protein
MFKSILIATDGGELAEKAVQLGLTLAKEMRSKVTVVRATPVPPVYVAEGIAMPPPPDLREHLLAIVNKQFADVRGRADAAGIACETVHADNELPWQAILETADAKGCDLIVMASHGRSGFSAAFLGSETQKVLSQAKVPVLVCR